MAKNKDGIPAQMRLLAVVLQCAQRRQALALLPCMGTLFLSSRWFQQLPARRYSPAPAATHPPLAKWEMPASAFCTKSMP